MPCPWVPQAWDCLAFERQCYRVGGEEVLRASGDEPSESAALFELGLQSSVTKSRMSGSPLSEKQWDGARAMKKL